MELEEVEETAEEAPRDLTFQAKAKFDVELRNQKGKHIRAIIIDVTAPSYTDALNRVHAHKYDDLFLEALHKRHRDCNSDEVQLEIVHRDIID